MYYKAQLRSQGGLELLPLFASKVCKIACFELHTSRSRDERVIARPTGGGECNKLRFISILLLNLQNVSKH